MSRRRTMLGVVAAAVLVALAATFGWHRVAPVDFPIYYRAGLQILHGDFELYPAGVYEGPTTVGGHGFRYAPAIALLFVPLALLPLPAAAFVFFVLKLVTLVATFMIVAPFVQSRPGRLILASLLVTGGYVVEEFRNGNAHSLVLWLMVVAFARAERGQSVIPGAALAAAIATKLTPVALLAYFGVRQAITVCVATVASLAVLWQIPSAVWGPATTARLTDGFLKYSFLKLDEPLSAYNYSLRGALINFASSSLTPEAITGIWLVAAAVAGIVVAWVIRHDQARPGVRALELALVLTAIPLFSPHSQRIHFAGLAVPAAILWGLIRSEPTLPFRRLGMGALAVNALASTFLPLLLPTRELSLAYLDLSPYAFATLFLFVALLLTAIGLNQKER